MAQQKQTQLVSMRMRIRSLAPLIGLRIQRCHCCGECLIPVWETSTCCRHSQKQTNKQTNNHHNHQLYTNHCLSQFFFFFFFSFLGQHLQHMEVPRPGVKSERQFQAYTTATATPDPNPLSQGSNPHPHGY